MPGMGRHNDEFPLLAAVGLYAANIQGDGNCLFNALSDQIQGDQTHHREIRQRVIEYMRTHAAFYKQFVDVNPGGGQRRNPKRKNAGAYSSSSATAAVPTAEEIDRVFEAHLAQMAKGGTYGDNMEIVAFSAAYGVDVKIYRRDFAYMVSGSSSKQTGEKRRPMAHIAYHDWEHYSSIRNVDGPHAGLPYVKEELEASETEPNAQKALGNPDVVAPWKVQMVQVSLPSGVADVGAIHRALVNCKGNVEDALSELMDEDRRTPSSTQGSSSVERDQDSEDEEDVVSPKKRRDRRMSRASRMLVRQREEQQLQQQLEQEQYQPLLRSPELAHRPKFPEVVIHPTTSTDAVTTTTTTTATNTTTTTAALHREAAASSPLAVPIVRLDTPDIKDGESQEVESEGKEPQKPAGGTTEVSFQSPNLSSLTPRVRLKLSQPKLDAESAAAAIATSTGPRGAGPASDHPKASAASSTRTRSVSRTRGRGGAGAGKAQRGRPPGSGGASGGVGGSGTTAPTQAATTATPTKRMTAREKKEVKKQAQKAAAKERKQQQLQQGGLAPAQQVTVGGAAVGTGVGAGVSGVGKSILVATTKEAKDRNSPTMGIKTLFI